MLRGVLRKTIFIAGFLFALSPFASPSLALALGVLFGLAFDAHPYAKESRKFSKILLQICVVGLGFGMNLREVLRAGSSGFIYTALGIAFALAVGVALGKMLRVESGAAFLISVGTAICGGSAIAAVAPVIKAKDEDVSVSLGAVFILNAVALLLFPFVGARVGLTQTQFGLWAALAIHDTSSVVGACAKYGAAALAVGATVKLARALWIVPVTLAAAAFKKADAKINYPWFILLFLLAAVINTYVPAGKPVYDALVLAARLGLAATLYLIGSQLSRATLRQVGARPLIQGALLWVIVGLLSLALIRAGVIAL